MKKFYAITTILLGFALLTTNTVLSQSLNKEIKQHRITKTAITTEMLSGTYTFSYDTGTYSNLVGGTNMSAGMIWDDPSLTCPIGFRFKFFNEFFDTAWVSDPWEVGFGTDVGNGYDYYITPYGADLMDRAFGDGTTKDKSPISYLLVDSTPNRILKIEWKNAAFLIEQDSFVTRTNYINLQLWLYETTNNIEIHWGPHYVTHQDIIYPGLSGPYIGLNNDKYMKYYTLTGDSTKPTMIPQPEGNIKGTPPKGMIYKFDAGYVNNITDKSTRNYSFFPNPVTDVIHILLPGSVEWTNVQVFNLLGNEIINKRFTKTDLINIDVHTLPQGTYLIKLQNAATTITHKFTKQ